MCTINPLYHIAKIYKVSAHLLMTYRETVVARNLLTSRREPWATSETEEEILAYSLLPCRIAQRALGLLTVYEVRWLTHSYICILTRDSKFGWSQILTSIVVRWVHCLKLALSYCAVICLPQIHSDLTHPLPPPLVLITWAVLWEKVGSGLWVEGEEQPGNILRNLRAPDGAR